jgi:hypothetical protein
MTMFRGSACSYPKERFRELQKEAARQAAELRTPEERCRRLGGVMNAEQCYTPSAAALDERTYRLRSGLYLNEQCLNRTTQHSYTTLVVLLMVAQPSWLRAQARGLCHHTVFLY